MVPPTEIAEDGKCISVGGSIAVSTAAVVIGGTGGVGIKFGASGKSGLDLMNGVGGISD